jgi:hypothetical protein
MKIVMKIVMSTCKIICLLVVFMNSLLLDGIRAVTAVSQKMRDGNILFGTTGTISDNGETHTDSNLTFLWECSFKREID